MARVTIEDCLEKVPTRFGLVHLAAKRVRQLYRGAPAPLAGEVSQEPSGGTPRRGPIPRGRRARGPMLYPGRTPAPEPPQHNTGPPSSVAAEAAPTSRSHLQAAGEGRRAGS